MTTRDHFMNLLILLLMLMGGMVLVSLFFQAWTWAPWLLRLLSSVSWNA